MATRWGIVGAGKICHDFTAALRILPTSEHEVVAVAARDLLRAKEFAKTHKIENAYGSYEELANDENVEVAYIGTLHPFHHQHAKMMLEAGKHVLCEKPMTMNLKHTKELIELAECKGLFLMEGIWSRCFPAYETLRNELAKGTIGEVRQVIIPFGAKIDFVERLVKKKLGGGSILDLGVYAVQLACLIYNHETPVSIQATGHLNREGVDLSMSAILTYENGRTAMITTQLQLVMSNEAVIIGTEGTIRLPDLWCPASIILPRGTVESKLPVSNSNFNFQNSSGLSYEAAEVRDCLKKGLKESPKVTRAHSLLIADIEDQLRRQVGVVYDAD